MNLKFISELLTNLNTPDGKLDYRKLAFPVVSVLVSAVVIFLVVLPQIIQLINNQKILNDLNTQVDNLDSKIAALSSISTPEYETNLNIVTKALPGSKDYIDSTPYIQDAIDKSKVQLTGLSFSESPATGALSAYQIKVDITGNLLQLNQFLSQINRSVRVIRVSKIDITSGSSGGDLSATISILAYYSAVKKPNLSISQPVINLSEQEQSELIKLDKSLKTQDVKTPTGQVGRSDPFN